jgi:L-ribulose-5-phosphate 4-epimerase
MLKALKEEVFQANLSLWRYGLVTLTWGNVSGIDRSIPCVVIKPSGVDYESLTAKDMIVVDMNGKPLEGSFRPSSDTPTHLELYNAFPEIGGIVHTHSIYATMFAQACSAIPCFGTTHADHFNGPVPVTRFLNEEEVQAGYERETGKVIIERLAGMSPSDTPAVLVAGHAPFTWGKNAGEAVRNSLILERVAQMAIGSLLLKKDLTPIPSYLQEKHYRRKHGPNAYYGQRQS